ncbi:hypothetical protein BH11CYA1_BH11CYA1_35680 [soil metagenome]
MIAMSFATKRRHSRSAFGSSIAEMPVALWAIFIGLLFPLAILTSMGYRASIVYFATDAACRKASKAPSFTEAQTRATTTLTTDLASFSGISNVVPTLTIKIKSLGSTTESTSTTVLPPGSVNTSQNIYFVILGVDADIDPIVHFNNGFMGMSVPGLTGPYTLHMAAQAYVENPNGLTE